MGRISFKRFINRYTIIGGVVLVVALLFIFARPKKQAPLQYATARRGTIKAVVSASGELAGKNSINLKFRSGGKLGTLNVAVGDNVNRGDVVATLDTQDLNITLQQAQNTLRDKQAAVDKVLDDIHLSQYGNGGSSNIGTANETQTQRQARTDAETARDSAVDTVKSAQRAFQDAVISAPFSGVVTSVPVVAGQVVGASDTVLQLVDESETFFDTDVDESDIAKVSVGQHAEIALNAYPDKTFSGAVTQILPQTKITSSGATVVTTRISLPATAIHFVPGLNGQVSIITDQKTSVLTLPQETIRDDDTVIVKEKNGNLHPVKVTIGLKSDTDVEIKSGLKEGDQVLTNPALFKDSSNSLNPLARLLRGFTPRIR